MAGVDLSCMQIVDGNGAVAHLDVRERAEHDHSGRNTFVKGGDYLWRRGMEYIEVIE